MIAHDGARRSVACCVELFKWHRRHFDVQINAVEQGAADFRHIAFNLRHGAMTLSSRIVAIAARAWIQGSNEYKVGRKRSRIERTADGDVAVFERLSQNFQRGSIEFGELVQKQDADDLLEAARQLRAAVLDWLRYPRADDVRSLFNRNL